MDVDEDFRGFVAHVEPRLRRAFVASHGVDRAGDAVAEALAWAWEHWDVMPTIDNPVGYLYRVGQSRTRRRRTPRLPAPNDLGLPDIEPGLLPALRRLPSQQRVAVWLIHGCRWRYAEVAEAMGITASAVGTHVSRGLERLRAEIGGVDDA